MTSLKKQMDGKYSVYISVGESIVINRIIKDNDDIFLDKIKVIEPYNKRNEKELLNPHNEEKGEFKNSKEDTEMKEESVNHIDMNNSEENGGDDVMQYIFN